MDTYLLKLSGKAELPERIETGHNYHVSLEGSITSEVKTDNEDGTHTYVAGFRPVKIELLDPKGKMLKLKDTRTASQILRARFYGIWTKNDNGMSFNDYYDYLMNNLIFSAHDIAEMYGPKKS